MEKRCIIIPAIKKNAVIPDQLVKKLAGVTLIERAIETARAVAQGKDIYVLTDSQEISLICERLGVQFRRNRELKFETLNIVAEMRDILNELAPLYEHCIILRASCPLITWVDVEDAWHKYIDAGMDSLVTVKSVHQRIWSVQGKNLAQLLDDDEGEREVVVESRAIIILRSEPLMRWLAEGRSAKMQNVMPYFSMTGPSRSSPTRTGGSANTCFSAGTWSSWLRDGPPSAWGISTALSCWPTRLRITKLPSCARASPRWQWKA